MISNDKMLARSPVINITSPAIAVSMILRWAVVIFLIAVYPRTGFALGTVEVRSGDHPTFSRIVFDWQQEVSYTARLEGNRLKIIFDKALVPKWGNLSREPLAYMADPKYRIDGNRLIVTLKVIRPGRLKQSRYGTKTAFDIIGDTSGNSAGNNRETYNPAIRAAVRNRPAVHEVGPQSDILKLNVRRTADNVSLNFPWKHDVPAAAFIRYRQLWVVFGARKNVDLSDLDRLYGSRILSARQINNPSMTILMYRLVAGQSIKMRKVGSEWYVDINENPTVPFSPITSHQQQAVGGKGESFFYAVGNSGPVVILKDPVIGDKLAVLPVMEASQGVVHPRKFIEFESLATAQGIAITLISDRINVIKVSGGIRVSTGGGLALTRGKFSAIPGLMPQSGQGVERLVNFTQWAQGPLKEGDYHANEHELLYRLSGTTDANRGEARWQLARFYLANGRRSAAYGVLQVMLDDEPKLINSPEFRIVLAVTNILMRRFRKGASLLYDKKLFAEKDIFLWRAVANDALGNYKKAFEDYKKGSGILSAYAPRNQIPFLFAATHSAYQLADRNFVKFSMSLLEKLPLTAAEITEVDYWRAVLERDNGERLKAEKSLKSIVKAGVRQTAARAKFDLINMELIDKQITVPKAIDQFEKLRFAWRGDNFELDLLSRLGDLYVGEKEFNTGLETLKLAVTFFRDSKKTAALTRQMSQIYRGLFLNGGANSLDPVKAVALYSEFRELIPLGKDGDSMTRRLADRLVSLDLLADAAKLLDHQVRFRLKGGAQSVVAGRLAMIYLLDSKPEKALGILRATRDSQIPEDVQDHRRMIEGRALIELGRYQEAEVLIEGYNNTEAENMRSDIYWRSKNWNKYIHHEKQMLRIRNKNKGALGPKDRLSVLRLSVAYVMQKNSSGIKALREKYKTRMDKGSYGEIFDVITAAQERTNQDPYQLIKSIASVAKFETFMESYKKEFEENTP